MPVNSAWPEFDVRTRHGFLSPVERQREGAEILAPERRVEIALQRLRLHLKLRCELAFAEMRPAIRAAWVLAANT